MRASVAIGWLGAMALIVGCGDDKKGSGIGPDTSWQIVCVNRNGTTCSVPFQAHGPLDADGDGKTDQKVTASCSKSSAGITVTLNDPGEKSTKVGLRTASQLRISNINLTNDRCSVQLEDRDPISGALVRLYDTCAGNGQNGTCTLDADEDEDGYALEGTLTCTGMRNNDQGPGDFQLRRRASSQPVVLQVAGCD